MSVCAPRPARAEDEPDGGRDDVRYTVQEKAKFDVSSRSRILDLLRPGDPATESLEDIVRPLPRRGLVRPYDDDTRRFLQRVLLTPTMSPFDNRLDGDFDGNFDDAKDQDHKKERSLADELREAEEDEKSGSLRRDLLREFRKRGGGVREAIERDRLGKLALSVEQDESEDTELSVAARRLDALLAESRSLHRELAGIHEDIQAECVRACRCAETARALTAESRAVRYLDDVVALLRGDLAAVGRVRDWPFACGRRQPDRNYVV